MNLQQWLEQTAQQLSDAEVYLGHGTDNCWDEALHLTLPLLGLGWHVPSPVLHRTLTEEELARLKQARERRIQDRVPTPYITGQAWFAGLPFNVDERVLIPRSPMGELINHGFQPWLEQSPARILDLCCGSACIAIACANVFHEARIDASDLCAEALAVAATNVATYDLGSQLRLVQSDLFSALQGERYDLIVCNPPYVDAGDMASLPPEYLHEPRMALASGDDGLDFTRRLLREAADHLTADGLLFVEVGNTAEALETAYPTIAFEWIEFEHGGDGVFVMSAAELAFHAAALGRQT